MGDKFTDILMTPFKKGFGPASSIAGFSSQVEHFKILTPLHSAICERAVSKFFCLFPRLDPRDR
jgi:hypothetical protein